MERILYKGFEVILGDADTEKCKEWRELHWKCTVKDKLNRKQMSFDVFGGRLCIMKPLEALYLFVSDACSFMNIDDIEDVMNEFGYTDYTEAKNVFKGLERAYYKCRKFIGSDSDIIEIENELAEEWG
jgi:hypothetical protein